MSGAETATARVGRQRPSVRGGAPLLRVRGQYDSATTTRRARAWLAPPTGPNAATLPDLATLRARSRAAARNDPYGHRALTYRTAQLVGTGIAPKSLAPDEAFRERVQALWTRWTAACDADGQLDFAGLQAQATRCWQEAGEVFVRLRDRPGTEGLAVPLQLQVLEPELCPLEHMGRRGANTIRAGIELSPSGQRVAYWFYRAHPADGVWSLDAGQLVTLSAASVIHLYLPERPGQLRGVPHLAPALLTLRDLDLGDDATLLRIQLGNMLMGKFTRAPVGTEAAVDPLTGRPIDRDAQERALVSLEPGTVVEFYPGEEFDFLQPPEAGQTYEAFVQYILRRIAAAIDTPYHALTGDMTQVNDRTIRVILQDFRRALEQLQWAVLIHQLCRPVWQAWFRRAVLAGALPVPPTYADDPAPWEAVEWAPDRWPYIHPVQDVEADRAEVQAGFASRLQKVKERGYDVEDVDRQRADDAAREARLGLVRDAAPSRTAPGAPADTSTAPPAEPVDAGDGRP